MKRRTALAAILSGGATLVSGCSLNSRTVHEEPSTAEKFTRTRTQTPVEDVTPSEQATTATRQPGDVPADRIVDGTAVSADGIGVTADRWFGHDSLPYRDDDEELETVESDVGWFVAYEFTIENVGDEPTDALPDAEFLLGIGGDTFDHVHSFPGDVPFDAIDQPAGEPEIRPLAWYDSLAPGEGTALQLVYEASKRPEFRHYLVWDHDAPVEGHEDEVYLEGEFVTGSSD